jgi:hypothetical protein
MILSRRFFFIESAPTGDAGFYASATAGRGVALGFGNPVHEIPKAGPDRLPQLLDALIAAV